MTVVLLYAAGLKISFSPFKIEFLTWPNAVGWLLIVIGFVFLSFQTTKEAAFKYYEQGYRDGATELSEELIKQVKENAKSNKETSTDQSSN